MSNFMNLDPKKFKHIKSDEHSTTLQHKDGHVLRIAHNKLSDFSKAQLKALSSISKENQTPNQAQEAQDQNPKMAKGGELECYKDKTSGPPSNYAEGGETKKRNKITEAVAPVKKFVEKYTDNPNLTPTIPNQPNDIPGPTTLSYAGGTENVQPNPQPSPSPKVGTTNTQPNPQPSSSSGVLQKIQEYFSPERAEPLGTTFWDKEHQKTNIEDFPAIPHKYADGTPDSPVQADPNQVMTPMQQPTQELPPGVEFGRTLRKLISENPHVQAADALLKTEGRVAKAIPGFIQGLTGNEEQPQTERQPQSQSAPQPQPEQQPQNEPTPQDVMDAPVAQQQPQQDQSMLQAQGLMDKGYQNELAGLKQEAAAKGQLGQQQSGQLQANIAQQGDAKAAYAHAFNSLDQERQSIAQDMANGHIDPEKYWKGDAEGNGGHSKIMTGLGIILAGFNPTNNPNAALNFLKFQMEQNLKGQELEMNKENNLLSANYRQFGNLKDAADMTRLQQADILHNQMLMSAAQAQNPLAKSEMLQKAGQLQMNYAPLRQQFAMKQALMNLANGQTSVPGSVNHSLSLLDVTNPEMAKEYRSRYYQPYDVPGGKSLADRPITLADREALVDHDKFDAAAKRLHDIVSQNRGTIESWNPVVRVQAAQQALILQSLFRKGTLGTVYREGEQPLLDKAIKGQPLSLVSYFTEIPKIEGLIQSNDAFRNTLLNSYDLKPPQRAQQQNIQHPEETPVKGKDGRMYIRRGNYMVPTQ